MAATSMERSGLNTRTEKGAGNKRCNTHRSSSHLHACQRACVRAGYCVRFRAKSSSPRIPATSSALAFPKSAPATSPKSPSNFQNKTTSRDFAASRARSSLSLSLESINFFKIFERKILLEATEERNVNNLSRITILRQFETLC